jgi:hypothetical protein
VNAIGIDGKEIKGRIGEVVDGVVVIGEHQIPLADIEKAMIEIEFKSIKGEK